MEDDEECQKDFRRKRERAAETCIEFVVEMGSEVRGGFERNVHTEEDKRAEARDAVHHKSQMTRAASVGDISRHTVENIFDHAASISGTDRFTLSIAVLSRGNILAEHSCQQETNSCAEG